MKIRQYSEFVLFVDERPESMHASLREAEQSAIQFMSSNHALSIETSFGSAPKRRWRFDGETDEWVEHA